MIKIKLCLNEILNSSIVGYEGEVGGSDFKDYYDTGPPLDPVLIKEAVREAKYYLKYGKFPETKKILKEKYKK